MPTPTNTDYNINLKTGWVIITGAVLVKDPERELKTDSMRDVVKKRLQKLDLYNEKVTISDMTDSMEDWERRRTKKPFTRPKGMFIYRIIDRNDPPKVGRMELNEWPQR